MTPNEINTIADKIISAAEDLKADTKGIFDKEKFQSLKERENRWHEISMNQLSFYNNLLIALGTGFLAFIIKEFKPANISFSITPEWYTTIIVLSIYLMTFSTFIGLLCGYNRLVDFRYTHRANMLRRKLYENNPPKYGEGNYSKPIKAPIYYWIKDAEFLNAFDNDYKDEATEVKNKIDGCSKLADQLGKLTRNLLRAQAILFLFAILFFVISFL